MGSVFPVKRTRSISTIASSLLACTALSLVLLPTEGCKATRRMVYNITHHRRAKSRQNTTDYADNLEDVVNSRQLAIMRWSNFSDYQPLVQQFYDDRNYELAWTRDGRPTEEATALMAMFENAAQKGLNPEDYDAGRWPQRVARIDAIAQKHDTSDDAQTVVAQFDAAMTVSAMRFLSDLHLGRINPQTLNFDIDVPGRREKWDLATFVNDQLVDAQDVPATVATVEPQNEMYLATEKALGQYLELAKQQAAQPQPPVTAHDMSALMARLELEGDLPQGTDGHGAIVGEGIKHFQERHGLKVDGKLTPQTMAEMNVPMSERVKQLDDSLERWRWLPDNFVKPRLMVNLPEFMVRAYNEDGGLAFKMKVVDGEAEGNHDTPMFVRSMRFMIFRPYWNLPISIVKKELMKHLNSSGAAYLAKNDYEVVKGNEPVTGWTADDLEHGRYQVRQKPGPKNSLGLVKFMFPNEYDVYMHSTPEINLFGLARRDKSHGCIRLNDAEAMANWVLQGQGDWDEQKIHAAMYGTPEDGDAQDNKQVGLKTPLPVNITYLTANADEDGTVHFFDDIYGYDQQLEAALAKGRPYEKASQKINPKLTPGETE